MVKKETQELLQNFNFSKFSNNLNIVSRHCRGHYNFKIKHFYDFLGGQVAPQALPHVK